MRCSIGSGRVHASESDLWCTPHNFSAGEKMGLLYCHGGGATALEATAYSSPGIAAIVRALASRYIVLSTDLGGTRTYGNDTVIARVGTARTYLQSTLGAKAGPVHMIGASMGAQSAFVYARANPSHVASIVGLVPLIDLTDIHANNRLNTTADINTAYGGSYSEATYGATHNPATFASQLSMPIHLWYANDDEAVIAQTVLDFQADAPDCEITDVGALGHTPAAISAVPPADVLDFFREQES